MLGNGGKNALKASAAQAYLPIAANALVAIALGLVMFWGRDTVQDIDWTDFIIEFLSALTNYVLFLAVCFINIAFQTRRALLVGLSSIEFGRFLDALDEIILFQDHFWSIGGDGLTLIGELLVAYAAIRHLIISNARADTDALTGLYNRRYHEQTLMQRIRTTGRTTDQLALIALDLDNFKLINDTFGHKAGDTALKHTARVLKNCSRQQDIVSRVGGEEFELIVTIHNQEQAAIVAERIRSSLEENPPEGLEALTASIGVSIYKSGDTSDALRERADKAVYSSKKCGKNRVTIAA